MVTLRPTSKLRKLLPVAPETGQVSDTALGDWYVNRIVVDRRPLLLLVSSGSLLAAIVPARDVRNLPERLGEIVASRLGRLGTDARIIEAELRAMRDVQIAKTKDRSVLGIMVDYAKMLPHDLEPGFDERGDLMNAEEWLWDNPGHAGRPFDQVVWPRARTADLLTSRWAAV